MRRKAGSAGRLCLPSYGSFKLQNITRLAAEQVKPLNGLDKVRKWIEDRGLKRAAVTNAPRANAELMIKILGPSEFFDAVITGGDCEHAKPYPDPYLKALEVLKASKDHTFVFEDSVSGIKAGVAAGMPVVGITTRNPEYSLKEAKPAFLIKDYDDPKLWTALEELDKLVVEKLELFMLVRLHKLSSQEQVANFLQTHSPGLFCCGGAFSFSAILILANHA